MGAPRPAPSAPGDGPAGTGTPLILLAEPGSGVERALVKQWLREVGVRPSTVLPLDGPGLDRSLAATPPDTVVAAARARRGAAGPLGRRPVADQPAPATAAVAAGHHAARARPGAAGGRGAGHGRGAARALGRRRLVRELRVPAGKARAGPFRTGAARIPLQGAEGRRRGDRGQPGLPYGRRRAREQAWRDRARGRGAYPGGPRRPGLLHEPGRGRPALGRAAPAARPRVGRPGGHGRPWPAARAEPPPCAGLPAQPPLVRGPAPAGRRPRRA